MQEFSRGFLYIINQSTEKIGPPICQVIRKTHEGKVLSIYRACRHLFLVVSHFLFGRICCIPPKSYTQIMTMRCSQQGIDMLSSSIMRVYGCFIVALVMRWNSSISWFRADLRVWSCPVTWRVTWAATQYFYSMYLMIHVISSPEYNVKPPFIDYRSMTWQSGTVFGNHQSKKGKSVVVLRLHCEAEWRVDFIQCWQENRGRWNIGHFAEVFWNKGLTALC